MFNTSSCIQYSWQTTFTLEHDRCHNQDGSFCFFLFGGNWGFFFLLACQGVSLFGEGGGGRMTITFLSPQNEGKREKKNNVVGKASSKKNNSLSSTASHFSYSTKVLLRVTRQYLRNSTQWFTCCQSYLHHYSNFQMVTSSRKTRSLWSIHTQCTMTRKSGKNQSRSHQVKERSQNIQIWLLWHLFGWKTTTTHNKYIWNN